MKGKPPHQEKMENNPWLRIQAELNRQGITDEYIVRKLKEELEAKETKFFQKDGIVKSFRNVIAWGVRQRAREDACEIKRLIPPRQVEAKHEHSGGIVHDLTERLEKAIGATEDAIRGGPTKKGRRGARRKSNE